MSENSLSGWRPSKPEPRGPFTGGSPRPTLTGTKPTAVIADEVDYNPPETVVDGKEIVVKPDHYTRYKIEPITFIMENGLSFEIGNIVKYAVRAGSKLYQGKNATESEIIDLEKVRRYAEMRINKLKGKSVL